MRHPEGLHVSLLEEGMLDSSGILKSKEGCASTAYGLSDESVQLFLLIAAAGEGGLAQSRIPKELRAELSTHLLPLELQTLVAWERDNREEAISAARTPETKQASWASRRKASVND
jgi:hypothetical protein